VSDEYRGAFDMLTSPAVRAAFDLSREADKTREKYGRTKIGTRCLLARRLAEAGAPFVMVDYGYDPEYGNLWDNHNAAGQNFPHICVMAKRPYHLAGIDRAFAALIDDLAVRGQLDETAPRPVKNGRVVAHVSPAGIKFQDDPPQWHAWATVNGDGSFSVGPLPSGDLEILAMCDGFVSTNGPGQFHMRYPQKHLLGTNDIAITIGMEPTARLEVTVTDDNGQPLKDASVMTWPNARYGEWSAVILMGDCYNTAELLQSKPGKEFSWGKPVPDFQGVSDSAGVAVLPNLPADVNELAVEHPRFALPAVGTAASGKRREASVTLIAGQTNRMSVQLEPRERSTIKHY